MDNPLTADDPHLPLLTWWALEYANTADKTDTVRFPYSDRPKLARLLRRAGRAAIPLRGHQARRGRCSTLFDLTQSSQAYDPVLRGIATALQGNPLDAVPAAAAAAPRPVVEAAGPGFAHPRSAGADEGPARAGDAARDRRGCDREGGGSSEGDRPAPPDPRSTFGGTLPRTDPVGEVGQAESRSDRRASRRSITRRSRRRCSLRIRATRPRRRRARSRRCWQGRSGHWR